MNKAIQQLEKLKQEINPQIDLYFEQKKIECKKISPMIVELIDYIHKLCQGGKRIRAAMIYYGYLACGGVDKKNILELSLFIELIHSYFLIHDDIIDQDDTRRGKTTMHKRYEQIHKKRYTKGETRHFGLSMAIMAGDFTSALGHEIVYNSKFNNNIKNEILKKINLLIMHTVAGEMLDVDLGIRKTVTRENIFDVYKNKTAQYTMESPLHIGAIASEKNDKKTLDTLSKYANPLGIAFQIQDDILGIFGNEKKLGKPIGSDICEGKQTILVWKAFQGANNAQEKILNSCLGNNNLTQKQINDFRQVIIDTKALSYSQQEAKKLLTQSLDIINKYEFEKEGKDFLIGIAEYLINRDY